MKAIMRRICLMSMVMTLGMGCMQGDIMGKSPESTLAIESFYQHKFIQGRGEAFHPNEYITREGLATILARMIGSPVGRMHSYKDVKGRWSEQAIATVQQKKIMTGTKTRLFYPERRISRQQFAIILYNYMKYQKWDVSRQGKRYRDDKQIEAKAKRAVYAVATYDIMPMTKESFLPRAWVTRKEAVMWLHRLYVQEEARMKPAHTTNLMETSGVKGIVPASAKGVVPVVVEEKQIEQAVLAILEKEYGSIKAFSEDGVLYWQGDILHVRMKSTVHREAVQRCVAVMPQTMAVRVTVQAAQYSTVDYQRLIEKAKQVYIAHNPQGKVQDARINYIQEKIVFKMKGMSTETRQALQDAVGNVLLLIVI